MKKILKNWITSVLGLIPLIATAWTPIATNKPFNFKEDWFLYLLSGIVAISGFLMKDDKLKSGVNRLIGTRPNDR